MRPTCFWIIPLALMLMGAAATGHAADRSAGGSVPPDAHTWWAATAKTLALRGDTDSLVTAGAILQSGLGGPNERARGRQLVEEAGQREPASADIAAIAMLACSGIDGCDPARYVERYRRASPQDARAWLPALTHSTNTDDDAAITGALAQMAAAQEFGGYWIELMARFHRALAHVPPPPGTHSADPDDARWATALNLATAVAIPGYESLIVACKPGNSAFASREFYCHRVGQLLARGETLVQNMIGLRLLEWTARDAVERDAVLATRHRMQWQKSASGRLDGTADWADALLRYRSESRAMEARLEAAGLPLDPPEQSGGDGAHATRE